MPKKELFRQRAQSIGGYTYLSDLPSAQEVIPTPANAPNPEALVINQGKKKSPKKPKTHANKDNSTQPYLIAIEPPEKNITDRITPVTTLLAPKKTFFEKLCCCFPFWNNNKKPVIQTTSDNQIPFLRP